MDREFAGTSYPTRTTTFDEQRRNYARLLGNVNLIVAAIVGAVFFSALAMLGVSNVRSINDAVREIAVLRVMGFPFHWIACVFLTETAIPLLAGLVLGVVAVAVSGTWVASLFPMDVGVFSMSWLAALGAVALAATCAGCFGVSSFRCVSKVRIVRGLGGAR